MRVDTIRGQTLTDPTAYEENVKLAREVADVLRKNIVQARRTSATPESQGNEVWSAYTESIPTFLTLLCSWLVP